MKMKYILLSMLSITSAFAYTSHAAPATANTTTAAPATAATSAAPVPAVTPATTAAAPAQAPASADISGTYQCQGYDPYNKNNYNFPNVTITKNGDVYNIQWQDANGNPLMLGNAVQNPDAINAYAIMYWPLKRDYYNVGLYVRKPDGTLESHWLSASQGLVGTETCTRK
jgi:hypothetical protein